MTPPQETTLQEAAATPWYRDRWPWLIISGPALVVIAGCYTMWLAVVSNDGLVADDYYKRGLAINQTLTRDRAALAAEYEARVMFAPEAGRVRVLLTGRDLPPALTLRLAHPTRAGLDYTAQLVGAGGGVYEGAVAPADTGRWRIALEDERGTWRLTGELQLPAELPLILGGRHGLPPR